MQSNILIYFALSITLLFFCVLLQKQKWILRSSLGRPYDGERVGNQENRRLHKRTVVYSRITSLPPLHRLKWSSRDEFIFLTCSLQLEWRVCRSVANTIWPYKIAIRHATSSLKLFVINNILLRLRMHFSIAFPQDRLWVSSKFTVKTSRLVVVHTFGSHQWNFLNAKESK